MPKKTEKKISVALKDIDKVCRVCGKISDTVRSREYYAKDYQGPCGDSFCYASCDMSACRPVRARVCAECEKEKVSP